MKCENLEIALDMCNKFIISPISLLSATYLLCICSMEIADARLLMIPHERHSNQNEMTMNDNIEKVIFSKIKIMTIFTIYSNVNNR